MSAQDDEAALVRAARRRRLASVFGDVLPDQTTDDLPDHPVEDVSDEWLRAQVPPHHGNV